MQTINVVHTTYFVFNFFPAVYVVSAFHVSIMRYLSLKFHYITGQVKNLDSSKKDLFNRKLSILIRHYNRVQLELFEMDQFFRGFNGFCRIHFFG